RRKTDDFHVLLGTQFTNHWAKDTGADWLLRIVDQHSGVRIEADNRTVFAADIFTSANDNGPVNITFLDLTARRSFFNRHNNNVANASEPALGTAQHLDTLHAFGSAIISDLQVRLHLDHGSNSFFIPPRTNGAQLNFASFSFRL